MSKSKPKMARLFGAAFGFNTDRRVKPVHFATGFFVSLFGRQYRTELLNNVVAFTDGKDLSGNYALTSLHAALASAAKIGTAVGLRELHTLRRHLRCIANNDEAVFPIYGEKEFGCDYSTAAHDILTRTRDNDGFSGHFVRAVLEQTEDGRFVLDSARACMNQDQAPLRQIFQPLLSEDSRDEDTAERYTAKLGELEPKRLKRVAKSMNPQTVAIRTLCENADALVSSETKLRFLVVGLCIWLFRYLIEEGLGEARGRFLLLSDVSGDASSRIRSQSVWSYARLREALVASFRDFEAAGRFSECQDAWEYVEEDLNGRPKFEEFYGTLALRSGLAQPRASRVPAKHFEPQPDTLRILVLSVLAVNEGLVPLKTLLDRLFERWGIVFGGRPDDAQVLDELGYAGLDQDRDLTPNANALIDLLTELGLATRFSDGLVMCHSQPHY